jgi:GTP-binding protein
MVIGENRSSEGDLEVNPIREKKLTNVRSVMADDKIVVHPPRIFSLDDVIAYIRGKLYLVYK